jgi:hypothetical protein
LQLDSIYQNIAFDEETCEELHVGTLSDDVMAADEATILRDTLVDSSTPLSVPVCKHFHH